MALDVAATADRFEAVIPALRDEAAAGEAARRLTTSAHRALLGAGVFDLLRPRSLGGEEADLLSMVRAIRTLWTTHAPHLDARAPHPGAQGSKVPRPGAVRLSRPMAGGSTMKP